jgi:Mn2+/Fe2+ NRAMP family transporter
MKKFASHFRYLKVQLLIILSIVGPGIITAFADNDAGGVATYTSAAAHFGYFILIVLIPVTIVLAITQEIGARIAIVTGKGLADIIRERFGVRKAVVVFFTLFIVNFGVILQNLGGVRSALELFNLDFRIYLPLILLLLFVVITKSNYKKIQQFFFVLIFFYLAYLLSAILAKPDWIRAAKALVVPEQVPNFQFLFTSIAVLGTTVTLWGQFFINSYIKDKHVKVEDLKYSTLEINIGAFITNLFSFFMMVAVAATIFVNNITVAGADDAARAMQPLAGTFASALFGFGLLLAGFLGCAIVPLATAYAFSEFFGYQGTLNDGFKKSKLFYGFFIIQIVLGAIIIYIPSFSLFNITLIADFVNGMMLPVIFYFLYKIANNDELMGKYKNTRFKNFLLIFSGLLITLGTALGGLGKILGW